MQAAKPGSRALVLRVGIILLTAVTAAIHFSLLFPDVMFMLSGLGYLVLLVVLYAPVPGLEDRKPLVRWAFVGYIAVTILLWLAMGERSSIAYLAKAAEIALIALLLVERSRPGSEA